MSKEVLVILSVHLFFKMYTSIPRVSTRFFILEDLEENSQYQVTLTPVWDREDFTTLLSGNVLTFSVASEEEVKCSHSMSVDTNNSLFLHTACFN